MALVTAQARRPHSARCNARTTFMYRSFFEYTIFYILLPFDEVNNDGIFLDIVCKNLGVKCFFVTRCTPNTRRIRTDICQPMLEGAAVCGLATKFVGKIRHFMVIAYYTRI